MDKIEPINPSYMGAVRSGQEIIWAKLGQKSGLRFFCGDLSMGGREAKTGSIPPRNIVTGLASSSLIFRQTTLPFTKIDRIRAVLPQDALDSLISKPADPHFAIQTSIEGNKSRLLYAVASGADLEKSLADYKQNGIEPGAMVVSELGALPLLKQVGILADSEPALIIDMSNMPISLYVFMNNRLEAIRLVAPSTLEVGSAAIKEELSWLSVDLLERYKLVKKIIILNRDEIKDFDCADLQGKNDIELVEPRLADLGDGLKEWRWLRAAGLALAAKNTSADTLLDFRWGKYAYQNNWMPWIMPWRTAAMIMLVVLSMGIFQKGAEYLNFKKEAEALQVKINKSFKQALPNVRVMVAPKMQLQQALRSSDLSEKGDTRKLTHDIFLIQTRIPADIQLEWRQLHYENSGIELLGEVSSYEELERLESALKQDKDIKNIIIEDAQLIAKKKRVQFKLKLS